MRSLILAGGGIKVGYQAGCLQVFDDLGLKFDHVDAASGGCFNAAMMANGMTGRQIANQWREMDPRAFTTLDWRNYYKLLWMRAVATDDGLKNIFRNIWKLDFNVIRRCGNPLFTFNHFDFTQKSVAVVENKDLTEDMLIASVTLLGWFPAVEDGPNRMYDAVWCTDGNVGEAVARGADEIWAIWTVTDTPELRDGALAQYFHLVETVANAKFKEEWAEIDAVNAAIVNNKGPVPGGGPYLQIRGGFTQQAKTIAPPAGRTKIEQHLIKQEVPLHYLLNFSRDRMAAAVEMGVRDACEYARKIGLLPPAVCFAPVQPPGTPSVEFTETMRGFFMPGATDPVAGERDGRRAGNALTVRLKISTQDLDLFLHRPEHLGNARGEVDCPLLSGVPMKVTAGTFSLFVNDRNAAGITIPGHKRMLYGLEFADACETQYLLSGEKLVRDGRGLTVWPDTTTLYVTIKFRPPGGGRWQPFGAGIIHVLLLDFLKELTTFRVQNADGARSVARTLGRFATFWGGQIWDVYARRILDYAPF